jgi:hypothetical protein
MSIQVWLLKKVVHFQLMLMEPNGMYFLTSGNSKEYFAALTGLLQKVCESASQIGEFK